jgi:hypothetical protein
VVAPTLPAPTTVILRLIVLGPPSRGDKRYRI